MKRVLIIALALSISLIAGCSESAPTVTVESLVGNPERLKALRAQCKADHDKVGDALCKMAAEATRRRFMGSGTPYTPTPAPLAPPRPTPKD